MPSSSIGIPNVLHAGQAVARIMMASSARGLPQAAPEYCKSYACDLDLIRIPEHGDRNWEKATIKVFTRPP